MITAGIPSKGVTSQLIATIHRAIQIKGFSEIIIAINPGNKNDLDLQEFLGDKRISVIFHKSDIGLYGNFRFLANLAKNQHFVWYCTDDLISTDFIEDFVSEIDYSVDLTIPNWEMREFDPQNSEWGEIAILGRLPTKDSGSYEIKDIVNPEPSWIFGIWKTAYLKRYFPRKNFDWLDTSLLQRVFLCGKVAVTRNQNKSVIGTWNWANRKPNFVKGKKPRALGAVFYQFRLLGRVSLHDFGGLKLAYLRIFTIIKESLKSE